MRTNRRTNIKLLLRCNMERPSRAAFHSDVHINSEGVDEQELHDLMIERIMQKMATFQSSLYAVTYTPLTGGTYIKLLKHLAAKRVIINLRNNDNKCFLWCILRWMYPASNRNQQRIDSEL